MQTKQPISSTNTNLVRHNFSVSLRIWFWHIRHLEIHIQNSHETKQRLKQQMMAFHRQPSGHIALVKQPSMMCVSAEKACRDAFRLNTSSALQVTVWAKNCGCLYCQVRFNDTPLSIAHLYHQHMRVASKAVRSGCRCTCVMRMRS